MNKPLLYPLLTFTAMQCAGASGTERPNVLMIIVDDLRPELGCYGAAHIHSPNIDRLAAEGTVYTRAYCNIPVSGASRASLLTGVYPDLPERFASFDAWAQEDAPWAVPISRWFMENGYHAISNGKVFHNLPDHYNAWSEEPWRHHPDGYGKDWAEYNKWELWLNSDSGNEVNPRTGRGPFRERADLPDSLYDDGRIALKTVSDLRRLAGGGKPFFMAVGFWRPHLPFNAPRKYWDIYLRDDIPLASNRYRPENLPRQVTGSAEIKGYGKTGDIMSDDFHREARHGYFACVSFIDAHIGMITEELERLDLLDNTVIVILGDHGWHLGEHGFWGKHNLLDRSTNSPLIIYSPRHRKGCVGDVAEFVDIYPTLCDLAGIPAPVHLQGESLVNSNREGEKHAYVQWGTGINIVNGRFNYAIWPSGDGDGYQEMLFDHKTDPQENVNIAAYPEYEGIREKLKRKALPFQEHRKGCGQLTDGTTASTR